MAIVEVRIDDRLIHGQVSNLWVPHFGVERILIVDDRISQDEDRKAALKFGCPPQCKVSVFDASKAADKLLRHIDEGINVLIVCESPLPLLEMAKAGYQVKSVTVGNMSRREDTIPLAQTAYVTASEIQSFAELINLGVKIMFQPTPTNRREDLAMTISAINQGNK